MPVAIASLPPPPPGKTGWPWVLPVDLQPAAGGNLPRIRIVTPSYNQGEFLEASIRSVLLQRYPNLEYVVMDGGSTDDSPRIITKYAPWLTHWVSAKDGGQSAAINSALMSSDAAVMAWVNSDDYLQPGALQAVAEAYRKDPQAVAWVGDAYRVSRDGHVESTRKAMLGKTPAEFGAWGVATNFYQPSCFFSGQAFRELGGLNASLYYVMDVDLWIRLARLGRYVPVDQVLSCFRMYAGIKSKQDIPAREAELVHVLMQLGLPQQARDRIESHTKWSARHLQARAEKYDALEASYRQAIKYFYRRTIRLLQK